MVKNNVERYKRKARMIAKQSHFRVNQHSILRTEHVERLYEKKKNLNTNLNLKSEFHKQEETRMIKMMERAYLKAYSKTETA